MKKHRILVERALQKAEEYEKLGNQAKARYFLELAERAERVYDKIEREEKKTSVK